MKPYVKLSKIETLLMLLMSVASLSLNGFTLSKLWGWFLVPILNIPNISSAQGVGLYVFVAFLVERLGVFAGERFESFGEMFYFYLGYMVSKSLIPLVLGYVVFKLA